MDEPAPRNHIRGGRLPAVFIAVIILVAAFGVVLVYRFYDNGVPSASETPSSASISGSVASSSLTTTFSSASTISIANSTALSSIEMATGNAGGELIDPTLDSNTGQIYAITSTQDIRYNTLTTIATTSLVARTALTLPGSGVTLAVDPKTNMIYIQVYGCNEGRQVPNSCDSNPGGFIRQEILRANGSTDAIEGEIPILTNESYIAINPNTNTLYAIQSCPDANISSPCGRLLAFDAGSGALKGNLTMKAILGNLVVNSITNTVYIDGSGQVPTYSNSSLTQSVIAVDARNLTVKYYVPLNYTNTIDLSINEKTNTVYGFSDNIMGNNSSAVLGAISGDTGAVLFSVVVGTACSVYDGGNQGATVNTATNQVYLYTGGQSILGSQQSFTVFDGATGRAVGMLSSSSTIQTSIFDPGHERVYVIFDAGAIATIPSALMRGNVNQTILNVSCPPSVPYG
jgi:hypothetical protein